MKTSDSPSDINLMIKLFNKNILKLKKLDYWFKLTDIYWVNKRLMIGTTSNLHIIS